MEVKLVDLTKVFSKKEGDVGFISLYKRVFNFNCCSIDIGSGGSVVFDIVFSSLYESISVHQSCLSFHYFFYCSIGS